MVDFDAVVVVVVIADAAVVVFAFVVIVAQRSGVKGQKRLQVWYKGLGVPMILTQVLKHQISELTAKNKDIVTFTYTVDIYSRSIKAIAHSSY